MQDLYCTDPAKLHYKEFAPRMELLKYTKEGEETMTDVMEIYAQKLGQQIGQEIADKKVQETSLEFAKGLLADGMSIEFTARHSKLPIEEVRKLAEEMSA